MIKSLKFDMEMELLDSQSKLILEIVADNSTIKRFETAISEQITRESNRTNS